MKVGISQTNTNYSTKTTRLKTITKGVTFKLIIL